MSSRGVSVTVTSSGNMEITLDPIQIQTAKYTAAIGLSAPEPRGLPPAGLLAAHGNDIVDMFLAEPLLVMPPSARNRAAVGILAQLMNTFRIDPLGPGSRVLLEARSGEDAVAGRVLDVDVQVLTLHVDDDVQIELHAVADALLDGECMGFLAAPPARQFGPQEEHGYDRHGDGPLATSRRARYILGLGFCWKRCDAMVS